MKQSFQNHSFELSIQVTLDHRLIEIWVWSSTVFRVKTGLLWNFSRPSESFAKSLVNTEHYLFPTNIPGHDADGTFDREWLSNLLIESSNVQRRCDGKSHVLPQSGLAMTTAKQQNMDPIEGPAWEGPCLWAQSRCGDCALFKEEKLKSLPWGWPLERLRNGLVKSNKHVW